MMAGNVSGDAADHRAFDAAFCIRGNARRGKCERQYRAGESRFHVKNPFVSVPTSCVTDWFHFLIV